jgi:predicted DsbA family dithiol-disulfide isomerase
MKVEIWSDVMCPFCYIGKRKFEAALEQFSGKDEVSIEWKSFQLNPDLKTQPEKNLTQYLAEIKGWTIEKAIESNVRVTEIAKAVGLDYHLDKAIVANSFDAHRLSHLAKKTGLQDKVEELLFSAYFTEGKDTSDHAVLTAIGAEAGCDAVEVAAMLSGIQYAQEVQRDMEEAQEIGVRGVPFFVVDRKYAISGAQPVDLFLKTLKSAAE